MKPKALIVAAVMGGAALLGCDDEKSVENAPTAEPAPTETAGTTDTPADVPENPTTAEDFAKIAEKEITAENAAEVAEALMKELEADLAELGD